MRTEFRRPGFRRMALRISALGGILALVLTGCMSPPPEMQHNDITVTTTFKDHPEPEAAAEFPQLGGTEPGALVSMTPFDLIDPRITVTGATAYRIRYMSTSERDEPVEVSGVAFLPRGKPPEKGWQIVAFNHGNTGIDSDCGPSLYDDLLSQWIPISVLLLHGFAVVASDYEGLGGQGVHPFLNSTVLGRNVIDAVRALRHIAPGVGNRWAAFGGSLGGLASWAANEVAATPYGDGLDLVGAAAWVPVVNLSRLPEKAAAGTLTHDQLHMYFLAIMGMKRSMHPDIDLTQFIHGSMYDNRDVLLVCNGPGVVKALEVLNSANPDDLKPASPEAEEQMRQYLQDVAVPKNKTAAPMLVIYGSADKLVDQAWIESALKESCGMGSTIEWLLRPGEGHGDIDAAMAFPWVRSRFDDQAPINRCLQPFRS